MEHKLTESVPISMDNVGGCEYHFTSRKTIKCV